MGLSVARILKAAKVDADILGNKKGCDYRKAHPELEALAVARNKAVNEPAANRKAEALKLVEALSNGELLRGELINHITKELGLSLALNQLNKWLEGTAAEAKPRNKAGDEPVTTFTPAVEPVAPLIGEDEVVIKKSQVTFFEILWQLTTDEQKAEVKRRVADAAREAVLAAAEAAAEQAANEIASMFPSEASQEATQGDNQ